MNINFHYFGIKTLGRKTGLKKEDAHLIASYSQFVKDYSDIDPISVKEITKCAKSLAAKSAGGWVFPVVTTAFKTFWIYYV